MISAEKISAEMDAKLASKVITPTLRKLEDMADAKTPVLTGVLKFKYKSPKSGNFVYAFSSDGGEGFFVKSAKDLGSTLTIQDMQLNVFVAPDGVQHVMFPQ